MTDRRYKGPVKTQLEIIVAHLWQHKQQMTRADHLRIAREAVAAFEADNS